MIYSTKYSILYRNKTENLDSSKYINYRLRILFKYYLILCQIFSIVGDFYVSYDLVR